MPLDWCYANNWPEVIQVIQTRGGKLNYVSSLLKSLILSSCDCDDTYYLMTLVCRDSIIAYCQYVTMF